MKELWKPVSVKGMKKWYDISSLGRIRSGHLKGSNTRTRALIPRLMEGTSNNKGRLFIDLQNKATTSRVKIQISRLVLLTFRPIKNSNKFDASHLNHDFKDNRLCNLVWESHYDNVNRSISAGRYPLGENHHNSKVTKSNVLYIRKAYSKGVPSRTLSKKFGISIGNINHICAGRTWKNATLK